MHQTKKHKPDKNASVRCQFYMEKKRRQCAMQRKAHNKYCSEHMKYDESFNGERVPCPLDPNHSVQKELLEVHLKKCNLRKDVPREPWYQEDVNRFLRGCEEGKQEGNGPQSKANDKSRPDDKESQQHDKENQPNDKENQPNDKGNQPNDKGSGEASLTVPSQLVDLITKYGESVPPLAFKQRQHPGLDARVAELQNKKHAVQQSSLIGNLKEAGLFGIHFYVEFGCGRAELSRTLNQCILSEYVPRAKYGFGMVDRGVNRMKMDTKLAHECAEKQCTPVMRRSRIDIQHLHLDRFVDLEVDSVVGISKHLCGAATDLTLKAVFNSSLLPTKFQGMLIAMCCRHVCQWEQLLPQSREYLIKHGINDKPTFDQLRRVVSWAVSNASSAELDDQQKLGLHARRLIDESRLFAVRQLLPEGYEADIFTYCTRDITPENSSLCIRRKA